MKLSTAQVSALKTALRAFLALVVFILLQGLKVPVEFSGTLSVLTPIILKYIDPTWKVYGVGKDLTPVDTP